MNLLSGFSTLYFRHINLWSPIAPLLEEIDICAHWVFCRKFNSEELLFETFLDINNIFGSIQPCSASTFQFQYIIIFQTGKTLEPPSSTSGEDIHMRPLFFCKNFSSEQLLFETFFDIIDIFGSIQPQKCICFPMLVH